MNDELYDQYVERLCICLTDGKQSEANAEAIASLEATSEMLRRQIDASERYKIVRKFKRWAREEGLMN